MPVINVHSAATSGQLAPTVKTPGVDERRHPSGFDQMLAGELGDERDTTAHDGAESAVASPGGAAAVSAASGGQPGGDAPPLSSSRVPPLLIGSATVTAAVEAEAPDHAIPTAGGDEEPAKATSAKPSPPVAASTAPDAAAPMSRATAVASSIALGGGPVLGVAVADGLTPVAGEVIAPVQTDDRAALGANDARGEGRKTQSGDLDGSTAEIVSAPDTIGAAGGVPIPLVAASPAGRATGAAQADTAVRKGQLAAASLAQGFPAGTSVVTAAEALSDGRSGRTKADDLPPQTSFTDVAANTPARASAHHSIPFLPFNAPPIALAPVAAGGLPQSAAMARTGANEPDAAALQQIARLYAPHDGAPPSGGASGFARIGTIGQDTGVALARGVADGRDHVALRLDPPDLGRIDVQLSFGRDGGLRAVVASDNRVALDLLRRDLDQLQRALADAGVRADTQSFHFSERQSGGSQRWDAPIPRDQRYAAPAEAATDRPSASPTPRRLRSSGLIDVFA